MKRAIVASILGIALTAVTSARGQGVTMFGNYSNISGLNTQVRWGIYHPAGYNTGDTVNSGAVTLWCGTGTLADSSVLTQIASTPIFSEPVYGGGWYAMSVSGVGNGYAQIPASLWTGWQTLTFQVRGTSHGFAGASALWQETPATAGGSIEKDSPNFMMNGPLPLIIPEPSSLALAGLGAATLFLCRRSRAGGVGVMQ